VFAPSLHLGAIPQTGTVWTDPLNPSVSQTVFHRSGGQRRLAELALGLGPGMRTMEPYRYTWQGQLTSFRSGSGAGSRRQFPDIPSVVTALGPCAPRSRALTGRFRHDSAERQRWVCNMSGAATTARKPHHTGLALARCDEAWGGGRERHSRG
jgi:hypothetical protein